MAQLQPQISETKTQKSEGNKNKEIQKKNTNCKQSTTTKNTSDDAKIKLTSQTPINKSAKIYHVSDKLIGFWPCLNQDAHLISSHYFGVLKQHQCFDPTTTAFAAAHGTVQHNHLSCHSKAGFGEKHLKTWDWMHLTQFPSAS